MIFYVIYSRRIGISLIPKEELYMLKLKEGLNISDNVLTKEFFNEPGYGLLYEMYEESCNALDVLNSYMNFGKN